MGSVRFVKSLLGKQFICRWLFYLYYILLNFFNVCFIFSCVCKRLYNRKLSGCPKKYCERHSLHAVCVCSICLFNTFFFFWNRNCFCHFRCATAWMILMSDYPKLCAVIWIRTIPHIEITKTVKKAQKILVIDYGDILYMHAKSSLKMFQGFSTQKVNSSSLHNRWMEHYIFLYEARIY